MKMKKATILKAALLVYTVSLCAQQNTGEETGQENGPRRLLLSEIVQNIDTYRSQRLQLVLRLQHIYTGRATVSFYDEENRNITFDITGYGENPDYRDSLKHVWRGREYVVSCTVTDVDDEGDIRARLIRFEPYSLYSLPY
ncbi:MAG: hypothetical protein ACOC2H_06155 [Spirochaetota bacterium]